MKKNLYMAPQTTLFKINVECHLAAPSRWSMDEEKIPIVNHDGTNPPPDHEEPTGAKGWSWDEELH
ncbi:MAG: hypothetical protein PUH24_05890 [Prevotellaceae bacterium]|nr:hypothetical protein [Prevotellaceae bacterium]MDY6131672.1 hypothetical protein [Prevotella sp.]